MKRIIGLILAGVAVAGAFVLPQPDPEPGPDFVGPEVRESVAAPTASVWYCPWVASGALRDSTVMLAATVPVDTKLTLPQQIAGEVPDVAEVSLDDAGALVVAIGEIVRRGDTPVFVEFDDGPAAAAAVVVSAELLTGDSCVARIPKVWELPGGTTREGRTLTLRLFNPFPELAKVSVSGSSESGETGLVDLQNLDVPGRTWQDVNLNAIVPLLDDLSLKVTSSEGFVIPSLVVAGTTDEASWPGTAPAANWEFPIATVSGEFAPSLMLSNTAAAPVTAFIDVYTDQGVTVIAREVEVLPSIPSRVSLGDLADGALGIRVRATGPVAAAVIAEESEAVLAPSDEEGQLDDDAADRGDRIAGTVGITAPATKWLLPGLQAVAEGDSTLWLLNTGTEPATVTLQPLGVRDLTAAKAVVPPGSLLGVSLGYDVTVGGYLLESSSPVSVAWSVESPTGLMFVTGTVVVGDLALRVLLVGMVVAIAAGIAFLSRRNTSYHPPVEIQGLGLPPGLVVFSSTDCHRCKKVLAAARLVEAPLREVTYEIEPHLQENAGVVGVPLTLAIDNSGQLVAQLAGVVRVGTLRRAATRAGF